MAVESEFYSENYGFQDWSFLNPISMVDNLCNVNPQQTQFHFNQNLGGFVNNNDSNKATGVSSSSSSMITQAHSSMAFSLNSALQLQNQEIDFIIQFQHEKLRIGLHERRKREMKELLSHLETEASVLMKHKEEALAKAMRKSNELHEKLQKLEMENESWKRIANGKEAIVTDLNNRLEEETERKTLMNNKARDSESFFKSSSGECEYECECECDHHHQEKEALKNKSMACKSCKFRKMCVLFLPCRHLCSCKQCEAFLGFCPICNTVKEASMEVLLV